MNTFTPTQKGAAHYATRKLREIRASVKPPPCRPTEWFDAIDTSVTLSDTERYRIAVAEILRLVGEQEPGGFITQGTLSREMRQRGRPVLEAALIDLTGEGIICWNPRSPAPSRITRGDER